MKTRLPLTLLALVLSAVAVSSSIATANTTYTPTADLGNLMYVGDSITHGVNAASWRWPMHKIFADNGVDYNAVGVKTGNYSGGVTAGTVYGGQAFNNVHSSQASARAYEIAGRDTGSKYGRFEYSNIQNWLGQSDELNKSKGTYTGSTFTEENGNRPDTYFMLIGTNDLLSDISSDTLPNQITTITENLLGDMDTIVGAMQTSNANADIVVLSVPCWTVHANNNAEATHQAVETYNNSLKTWASNKTGVTMVDVNKGILDVASGKSFYGVSSMFNKPGVDGLHPSAQGDLLMAGNVAKGLGYAGRSAGQARKGASELAVNFYSGTNAPTWTGVQQLHDAGFTTSNVMVDADGINLGAEGTSSISYSWAADSNQDAGFTMDLNLTLGDGELNGWDVSNDLSITLGSDSFTGTLNINEAYIKWGETILYSTDMSANTETIRMAWLAGNNLEGLKTGYYVWLGDMLIGESLGVTYETGKGGLSITYDGSGNAVIKDLAVDGTASYAPTTTGYVNEAGAYVSAGPDLPVQGGDPQGGIDWKTDGFTASQTDLAVSGTYNARSAVDSSTGTGGAVSATITSGSTTLIYGNSGNYTGDVWVTIAKEGGASSWFGAHGAGGTLDGNAYLRLTDEAVGGSTVFGAVNATAVTGNVYVELSAENATFGSFTTGKKASLVGSYATNIGGNVDLVVNSGTLNASILGGIHTGAKTIDGDVNVYVNGGMVNGDVSGGGYTGTINGRTSVTITNGIIEGSVYGGGHGDTINGGVARSMGTQYASSVELTGGQVKGDVYGGGSAGTVNGNSGVLVSGTAVRLYDDDGTAWGNIYGGAGASGSVIGDSTVHIQNISTGVDAYGFDKYAGTISGGLNVSGNKTLILDNVKLGSFNATLEDFTHVRLTNGTNTQLSSLGGAHTLTIEDGCSLILEGDYALSNLMMGENSLLSLNSLVGDSLLVDITGVNNYTISLSDLNTNLDNITFKNGEDLFAAQLTNIDLQAGTGQLMMMVPEPSTATLGMLGLASLLMRRRRKA